MIGKVAADGVKSLRQGVSLCRIYNCDFLGECGIKFSCIEKVLVMFTEVISVEFVEFDGVDALAVLVDQLDHVFEEGVETFTLEIKTDQVARIVSLCL